MTKKIYKVYESRVINTYENKQDADADAGQQSLEYPENSYKVVEEDVDENTKLPVSE